MDEILIIDGYNLMSENRDLALLMRERFEDARDKLIDIVRDYQGRHGGKILLVFDGHRRVQNRGSNEQYGEVEIVFTKSGESADAYIERLVSSWDRQQRFTVVTSDGAMQTGIMSRGGLRRSSREMWEDIRAYQRSDEERLRKEHRKFSNLDERIDSAIGAELERWRRSTEK